VIVPRRLSSFTIRWWYDGQPGFLLSRRGPLRRFPGLPSAAGLFLVVALTACSNGADAVADAPGGEIRALTGAHTRVVWVQGDGTDPETEGDQLVLMGLDSDDGKGERVILGARRSYVKPRLTADGRRIVFSSRILPGPPEIFVVNWDGTGFRKLADGFALALWQNPADDRDWVYAGSENTRYDFAKVTRFPIDAPGERELVWDATLVSMEGFAVTPDGRQAGGMFPWPHAGIADLSKKTWKKLGEGCWTSLTSARGPLFWYFDGAHRNVTLVDVATGSRWAVNITGAPGFDGAEASHPRWTNHPRFLTLSGPYNLGGDNQVRSGGRQVEIYLGRFADDFSKVEAWSRVTNNSGGDSHPDVWIDLRGSPFPRRPAGAIGPAHARGGTAARDIQADQRAGRLVLNVRLTEALTIPSPQAILPYRSAMVVNVYDVMDVVHGAYGEKAIRIAQWAIRDGRVLADARRTRGTAFTLSVERYDAHPELEGERLISASEQSTLPLYYDVTPR
jgi:hypothetical protein